MKDMCSDHDYNRVLQALKALPEALQKKALEYIPTDQRAFFEDKLRKAERCVGRIGDPCKFGLTLRGKAAQTHGRRDRCVVCDAEALRTMCESYQGRKKLMEMLQKMHPRSRKKAILERIPPDRRGHFEDLLPLANDPAAQDDAPRAARGRKRRRSAGAPRALEEPPVTVDAALAELRRARAEWGEPLAKFRRAGARPTDAETSEYQKSKGDVQRRVRGKFGAAGDIHGRAELKGDVNGTGLPPATESKRSHQLELWATAGSWGVCKVCLVRQTRDCVPANFDSVPPPYIDQKKCWRCQAKRDYFVPTFDNMPKQLQNLTDTAAGALSPVKINCGPEIRSLSSAGFRQHAQMMTFSWHCVSVRRHIRKELNREDREAATIAFNYLYEHNPTYQKFVDEQEEFLREHPDATEQQLKRWVSFIEREGVECALWPRLFWKKEMCFTVERLTDPRKIRREKRGKKRLATAEERTKNVDPYAAPQDEKEGEDDDGPLHSIRLSYQAKALGPLLDYGSSYEILHFVFDLTLWTTLGARKNVAGAVPMRVMMKGHPMSPLYWRAVQNALIDMVRQCGYPKLFMTTAPYAKTFPYHVSVQHQLDTMQKPRHGAPVVETLHKSHVMMETYRGFVTGTNSDNRYGREARGWTRHLLNGEPGAPGKPLRLRHMLRQEFQDGARKAPTQDYHGSGEVHIHGVVFAERSADIRLDGVASATRPAEGTALRGIVQRSQLDWKGKTPWPVHERPNEWDEGLGCTKLRHDESDHTDGVRAYLREKLAALRCHMDLQETDDDGAMQAYLAKYPVKNSSGLDEEWLQDEAGANALAWGVLSRYKPHEPEMVLQLFGQKFRQWSTNTVDGGKRDFIVPVPDAPQLPKEIKQYEDCRWRGDQMSLLDFLRRTNKQGEIAKWLKEAHKRYISSVLAQAHQQAGSSRSERLIWEDFNKEYKRRVGGTPRAGVSKAAFARTRMAELFPRQDVLEVQELEVFAREFKMFGERVVAADCASWRNDKSRGQWLVLHVPFRKIKDFLKREVDAKLPRELRYLGMALLCRDPKATRTWRNVDNLREELRRQGNKSVYTEAVLTQTLAETDLVDDYLAGRLTRTAADEAEIFRAAPPAHRFKIHPDYENQIQSGKKTVEGRLNWGAAAEVNVGDVVLFGATRARILEVTRHDSFWDMLEHHGVQAALPGVDSIEEGVHVYHSFPGYARGARECGVVAYRIERIVSGGGKKLRFEELHPRQKDFVSHLRKAVDRAFAVRDAENEDQAQRVIDATDPHQVQVLFGPPGTGKTATVTVVLEEVLSRGGYVLFTVYTAELTSRLRQKFADHPMRRHITIDTCHAAFHLGEPFAPNPALMNYQLIVTDEVSQLNGEQNDRILRLRNFVDDVPAMAELGDRWQMSGWGDVRAWHTTLWRQSVFKTELVQPYRCEDEQYWRILNSIRTTKPEGEAWRRIQRDFLRFNKAWPGDKPRVKDLRQIMNRYPQTTFLAATRKGANTLDELCTKAKFPKREPITVIDGDVDSWAENYDPNTKNIKPVKQLRARPVPIYIGMPLYITRNIRKDVDYVNGMWCEVVGWNELRRTVTVKTATGKIFGVGKEPDEKYGDLEYYPLRHGFASTIMKKQGAELPHVTVYLDAPHVRAAAYTAMSRVKYMAHCLIGGHVTPDHFRPAD